jgi:thioredoxin-related protein
MKSIPKLFFVSALLLLNLSSRAQDKPVLAESAESIMNKAFDQAAKEGKNVILMFHASWCGWCKKMDASLNDESCREFFNSNYVITHLVVLESKGKEHLENPGAKAIFDKYSGGSAGIPFWLIYDSKGNVLEDSMMPSKDRNGNPVRANIGCPATDEEVEQFAGKVKRTSKIGDAELIIIAERFKKNRG